MAIMGLIAGAAWLGVAAAPAATGGAQTGDARKVAEIARRIERQGLQWKVDPAAKAGEYALGMQLSTPPDLREVDAQLGVYALDAGVLSAGAGLPSAMDLSGLLGTAKNQGGCGWCTTFAVVGAVEAEVRLFSGQAYAGSDQAVASCSGIYRDCSPGGATIPAIANYLLNYGTVPQAIYPYVGSFAACQLDSATRHAQSVYANSWQAIRIGSADDLKSALFRLQRPLVVGFWVPTDFYAYGSGVYSPTTSELDSPHAVLVVGYSDSDQAFRVRNSWGSSWGEDGHFRISYSQVASATTTRFASTGAYVFQGVRGQAVPTIGGCKELNASVAYCDIAAGTGKYVDFVINGEAYATSNGTGSGSMQLDMTIDGVPCNPSAGVSVEVDNATLLDGPGYTCTLRLIGGEQARVSLVAPNNVADALYTRATITADEYPLGELPTAGTCVSDTPVSATCDLSTGFDVQYADFIVAGAAKATGDGTGSGSMQLNMTIDGVPCNAGYGQTVEVDNETLLSGSAYTCSVRISAGRNVRVALSAPNDRADGVYTSATATVTPGPGGAPVHAGTVPQVFFDGFDTNLVP